jgi:hypothetical protein
MAEAPHQFVLRTPTRCVWPINTRQVGQLSENATYQDIVLDSFSVDGTRLLVGHDELTGETMADVPGPPYFLPPLAVRGVIRHATVLPVERLPAHPDGEVRKPKVPRIGTGWNQFFLVGVGEMSLTFVLVEEISNDHLRLASHTIATGADVPPAGGTIWLSTRPSREQP